MITRRLAFLHNMQPNPQHASRPTNSKDSSPILQSQWKLHLFIQRLEAMTELSGHWEFHLLEVQRRSLRSDTRHQHEARDVHKKDQDM